MAANINLHQPRVEHAFVERDDENNNGEPATPDGQATPHSDPTAAASTEQQGQSSGDGGNDAGTHDPANAPPLPVEPEAAAPLPAQFRYGLGEVSIGRPDYLRAYAERAEPSGDEPGLREPDLREPDARTTAFAPTPRAENTAPLAPAAKPIPMPKPSGVIGPTPELTSPLPLSKPALAPAQPAPRIEGAAMGSPAVTTVSAAQPISDLAFEQGMADLTLGEPLNKELIARFEQEHPNANLVERGNATADHLVATYGEARLNDMAKLHQALSLVRDDYANALRAAEARGPSFDNAAFWKSSSNSSGDGGTDAPVFDNEAFTRWYVQQDGLSNRAFAANYAYGGVGTVQRSQGDNTIPVETTVLSGGTSVIVHERVETASEGGNSVHVPRFAAPGLFILGGPTCGIELHDAKAVWFDHTLGFVTRATNVVDNDDFFDKYMMVIIVTAATAGAGAAGMLPTAATFGGGTSGAILAGAANSVITSTLLTAAQGGDITFKGMFQAALTGGIMGGLTSLTPYQNFSNLGLDTTTNTVTNYALRAVSITGQATLQGALRELVGGRFRDGFTQGIVQGLAGEITRALNNDIAGRVTRGELTAEQGRFLNEMSRATGSAIRAAANPNDPGFAFAQDYLTQLLGTSEATTTGAGNGTVPVDAETQQQLTWMQDAIDSGYLDTAATHFNNAVELGAAANPNVSRTDIANQLMQQLGIKPDTLGFVVGTNGNVTVAERVDRSTAVTRLAAAYRLNDPTISQQDAERAANAYIDQRGIPAVFPERLMLDVVVRPGKPGPFSTGSQIVDQIIGGLWGGGRSVTNFFVGIFQGIVSIARIPFDGWLGLVSLVLPDGMFADSVSRNQARIDMVTNIIANIDKLPAQVVEYFDSRLAHANQLEAQGDHIGAARERAELVGDMVLMVTNPRSPGVTRILDRLGMDPATAERTVQGLERTAEAQRVRVLARWESREREFVVTNANGNKYWDRYVTGGNDVATQLAASLERAGFPKPGDNYSPHHLLGFAEIDRRIQRILIEVGITPNAANNGVWLTREQHAMTYGNGYREWVAATINDYVGSGKPTLDRVNGALDFIRTTTQNLKPGTTPPWRK